MEYSVKNAQYIGIGLYNVDLIGTLTVHYCHQYFTKLLILHHPEKHDR